MLVTFLTGLYVLQFNSDDALTAGQVRANLARSGISIGPFDSLIAGQALARKLTVVTLNVGEFSRVSGLAVENWSK